MRWVTVAAALLLAPVVILAARWPFTQQRALASLEHFASSEVRFGQFEKIYFPNPGYRARRVTFSRDADGRTVQLASVEELECKGSWIALLSLTHHAKEVNVRGLRVTIPNPVPPPMKLHPERKEQVTVTEVTADGSVLNVQSRHGGQQILHFSFPRLRVANIGSRTPLRLDTVMRNPEPEGDLAVKASIELFSLSSIAQAKLSGTFDFTHAALSVFQAISGTFESHGRFDGTLQHCQIKGNARIPDFEVATGRHAINLTAEFATVVDGRDGDVSIESIVAHFLNTTVRAQGTIDATPGRDGKTASLKLYSEQARIEDLLRLFAKSDQPSIEGPMGFQAQVQLPPGKEHFLRKIRLDGRFSVIRAEFTRTETQAKVDELSNRARNGKRPKGMELHQVPSDVQANVRLRNGSATLSDLSFVTPGASAHGAGSYDLVSQKIDLSGTLAIQATLSKAVGGIKSILLMPLNPFFKKGTDGAVLPVRVTGDYSHPIFRVSLRKK